MITKHDDWWWPEIDRDAHGVIMADVHSDVPALLDHIEGRDVIVQAGGNVGVYPAALAKHFRSVFTVEPDEVNYQCLVRNLKDRGVENINHRQAAFGEEGGVAAIDAVNVENVGAHRIYPGIGSIEVLKIDDLQLPACDAIWLDVEGYELCALKGALDTIARYSPTISIEDKGLCRHFGVWPGEVQEWLTEHGYSEVARYGRDKVYRRAK
jgi:FkbM family methyltransferase